ncbi:transporter substrate-binding domain-containing protein [Mesorhizobium sp. VK25A]|uniref:Transporter substrate-binding domain-containing protein n=4 Tax=Mesorhizobium TaxID=68287 RepID=A0ABU5A9N2_9HYPH|nr:MULTISPECIES: transporter substrate-binding domain-containing protein [unclassified Mesorhizobium]MDX8442897.1 transporter substrate-binding domain-containing protein [Mesorhizobium sp. VK3E]MDX8443996.1 transporter substrate-binding domain-containing protein [Mesorhizobium sp. VK3C]MDX8469915.1 transporter substrate-binding domain-containing protein [Mesorhizobium sp. VK23B]MDX8476254.1 transporter substrate-binding domain-containing protein [Mesorhizobium sp. VK23A]MDX8509892.1 transporte
MLPRFLAASLKVLSAVAIAVTISTTVRAQSAEGYWEGVQKAGVLRCGAAVAPPYVMRDPATGEYSGFFAELCREFADVLKVKPQFVDTTWDNIVAGLQAGKWDLSLALNRTPPRAMAVNFSIPAMEYQISLVYNKSNSKIAADAKSVADIDKPGITLAVMSGTAQDKAISAAIKQAQVLRLPGNDETRLALKSHRADILVDASDTNALFTQANPDWAVALNPTPALAKQGVAFGLPHSLSFSDVDVVNIFLEERVATGQVDELIKKANDEVLRGAK